jgi:nucleoid-associated protein YgaU
MGIFSFVKGIGDKITGQDKLDKAGETATQPVAVNPATPAKPVAHEPTAQEMANLLLKRVQSLGLAVEGLSVNYNSVSDAAEVSGKVKTQADREKIILAIGNVSNVATVVDSIDVEMPAPESTMYTVKSGDTLSKIAKHAYGDPNAYNKIFDANKPMLSDPDKIYVGQVLRIPAP